LQCQASIGLEDIALEAVGDSYDPKIHRSNTLFLDAELLPEAGVETEFRASGRQVIEATLNSLYSEPPGKRCLIMR